ncbi:larval cuticle protein LCP-22-like [Planococcus citri]|uniref:larval cuticle protein LCP-22-like n=1 Tax=Planococcus citri TaxID=170843 RepID=UPI0031F85662
MAFRLALTALFVAAACSSSLASPAFYRIVRNADPAAAPVAAAKANQFPFQGQQVQQIKYVQPVQPVVAKTVVIKEFKSIPQQQAQFVQVAQPAPAPVPQVYEPVPVPAAAPKFAAQSANNAPDQQAQITGQSYDFNPVDNSFSYAFQTSNGISQQAKGYINQNGKFVQEGSYTLYTPEGIPVSISYIADENGYQAVGDAIPQPDPVIAKAIAYQRSLPPQAEDNKA